MTGIDIPKILELAPSPAYVVDLGRLRHNLEILDRVQQRSGAKILLALKAFALWKTFPLIRQTLHGVCASSPWEARLGREEFGREVHSFAAAFKKSDVVELLGISNHLVFNSFAQLERFRPLWEKEKGRVSIGLRINPEHSEGHTRIYDPCAPGSRLGIPRGEFESRSLEGVEGLHFHTLCEQLFEPLARTAKVVEENFGKYLSKMKWLNFGGGHHITREGYDIDGLVELIEHFQGKYGYRSISNRGKPSPSAPACWSAKCWTWCTTGSIPPFLTYRPHVTCRMFSRCLTDPRFSVVSMPVRNLTAIASAAPRAWLAT
jgi:carboxynorspermidine decarboxylase